MKAILTKRLPPTNTKPARIKAYDLDGNNVVLSVHYPEIEALDDETKHWYVASQFVNKLGWWHKPGWEKAALKSEAEYKLHGGATKEGYAWVLV